jgi:flagellar hook-associated protein 1 FlgK
MSSLNSLLSIGNSALQAAQTAIQVTSNNIANVNTPGYDEQQVIFQEGPYIDTPQGQIGTGVLSNDIQRNFNSFIESSYNTQASLAARYNSLSTGLTSVESLFNESNTEGINSCLNTFFKDWQNLATNVASNAGSGSYAVRESLLTDSETLMSSLQSAYTGLTQAQSTTNGEIQSDVGSANQLMKTIANLNVEIDKESSGTTSANGLLDERDSAVRQLGQILDVKVLDGGTGNYVVETQSGQTLVAGGTAYSLGLQDNVVTSSLKPSDNFNGTVNFSGTDDFQYTLKVVDAGNVSSGASAAKFEVSLDGGRTWLTSGSGNVETFSARPNGMAVTVGNLSVSFGANSNSSLTPTGNLSAGDTFTIQPNMGLYYYGTGGTPVNITPQTFTNGQTDTSRITGGSLGGEFTMRDYDIGRYKQSLDALSNELIYQVNLLHSQGAGSEMFSQVTGTYQVSNPNVALASGSSGLAYADKLSSGASMMYIYDSSGNVVSNGFLNFNSSGVGGMQLFDPNTDSISDVAGAVNRSFGKYLTATVVNGSLQIQTKPGYTFGFGSDATGLYAALGLNTFFTGSSTQTMGINNTVSSDLNFINAGHIDASGLSNSGDNSTALNMADLVNQSVSIGTAFSKPTSQTLTGYYNNLVGLVGGDTESASFNLSYQSSLATDLNNQQQSVAGVSLDEEMSNIIKYQYSYEAAAKLITTADSLFQTLLGMKQ